MSTIVTYNRGAQGLPNFDSANDADYVGKTFEFIGEGTAGFAVVDFTAQAVDGGSIVNSTVGTVSTFISNGEVFADLAEGKSFAYLVRAKIGTRANGDVISLGIAEDIANPISGTATHIGFEVGCGTTSALDSVKICYEDATSGSDMAVTYVSGQVDALIDFDVEQYHDFGFVAKRSGGLTTVDYYVDGKLLGSRSPVSTVFNDELFLTGYVAANGGDWRVSRLSFTAPR